MRMKRILTHSDTMPDRRYSRHILQRVRPKQEGSQSTENFRTSTIRSSKPMRSLKRKWQCCRRRLRRCRQGICQSLRSQGRKSQDRPCVRESMRQGSRRKPGIGKTLYLRMLRIYQHGCLSRQIKNMFRKH